MLFKFEETGKALFHVRFYLNYYTHNREIKIGDLCYHVNDRELDNLFTVVDIISP